MRAGPRPPCRVRSAGGAVRSAPSCRPTQFRDRHLDAHELALAAAPILYLHLAVGEALRPDDHLMWRSDQIHRGEFCPGPFVAVVVENGDRRPAERVIDALAGAVAR